MANTRLDHLVVAAASLDAGADYIRETLGTDVPDGGRHLMMGTHNKVMSLGGNTYLEIIAVDPDLAPPQRPRWFGLDDPAVIRSIAASPRLLTWAVNTSDLDALVDSCRIALGEIVDAQRDDLSWRLALTDDGRLSAAGFLPLCIQWKMDFHPAGRMADLGCRLIELVIRHPRADWLRSVLDSIGAADLVTIEAIDDNLTARLIARIDTPSGERRLESER